MLDREACERRVYRLAALLLGDPAAATRAIESVVDAQPDLDCIDSAHLDRLTILRSREIGRSAGAAATLVHDAVPLAVAETLAGLPHQSREAWVLARVYRLPPREVARAMDCSTTATDRHLARGDRAMQPAPGDDAPDAAAALLRCSLAIDVPAFYRADRRRRRLRRRVIRIAIAAVTVAALVVGGLWVASLRRG